MTGHSLGTCRFLESFILIVLVLAGLFGLSVCSMCMFFWECVHYICTCSLGSVHVVYVCVLVGVCTLCVYVFSWECAHVNAGVKARG